MTQSGSNKKVANGLVALSSAAVLAVYAAGYSRTRPAAEELEAKAAERRPAPERPRTLASIPPVRSAANAAEDAQSAGAVTSSGEAHDAASAHEPTAYAPIVSSSDETKAPAPVSAAAHNPAVEPASAASDSPAAVSAPAAVSPTSSEGSAAGVAAATQTASATSVPAPSPILPPPVTAFAVTSSSAPAPTTQPAATTPPTSPASPAVAWKDGTYLGWGSSRHGDIQASVVIEGSRIKSATIAQCLTRYSCSVIASLPPEVPQRQSADVDYVSGATQSANAFYYAVLDALGKAK